MAMDDDVLKFNLCSKSKIISIILFIYSIFHIDMLTLRFLLL